jgi:hypothetical protein
MTNRPFPFKSLGNLKRLAKEGGVEGGKHMNIAEKGKRRRRQENGNCFLSPTAVRTILEPLLGTHLPPLGRGGG